MLSQNATKSLDRAEDRISARFVAPLRKRFAGAQAHGCIDGSVENICTSESPTVMDLRPVSEAMGDS
jgi:hypothetical protein